MQVGMMSEGLAPGVQDAEEADPGSGVSGVQRNRLQGLYLLYRDQACAAGELKHLFDPPQLPTNAGISQGAGQPSSTPDPYLRLGTLLKALCIIVLVRVQNPGVPGEFCYSAAKQ